MFDSKRFVSMLIVVLVAAGLFAGGSQEGAGSPEDSSAQQGEQGQWPRTISDAAGHDVVLERRPERITLLHSYYLEDFLMLGTVPTAAAIGNRLGETMELASSEMYAPYLGGAEIMNLGSPRALNLEAILESEPDLIVTMASQRGVSEMYDQLSKIAPVILLDYRASWQDQLMDCAEMIGEEEAASQLIAELSEYVAQAQAAVQQHPERSFAIFRTNGKDFICAGTEAYYERFGLRYPESYLLNYESVSLEAVSQMNPYYIVFQHNREATESFVESMADSSVWNALDAVQNGRVYYFDENMNTNGPLATKLASQKLVEMYSAE